MVCPGGCINGAGMPFRNQKDDRKNLARMIYQADEHDAIDLPENSPVMMNFYDKLIAENNEIADKKIFHTHYVKRNVLL
jgi:iron only hydrogenase large subunit-like protein